MDIFRVDFANRSQQTSVTVKTELRKKIFDNGVENRTFTTVESVLVGVGKLWGIAVDVVDFDVVVVEAALVSVFEVFEDVIG